jgi:hypothetical protein
MNKEIPIKYFIKVIIFFRDYSEITNSNFGTKLDWAKHFAPHKYRDKNIDDIVNYLINVGVLKEIDKNTNGNTIYRPDNNGVFLCQMNIENTELLKLLEDIYDISVNNKKGTK